MIARAALDQIATLLGNARRQGRKALLETEGMQILAAAGFNTPAFIIVSNSAEAARVQLPSALAASPRIVVKVVSDEILHKSDVSGVRIVANEPSAWTQAIMEMEKTLSGGARIQGYSLSEFIPYDPALGNELLLGFRWTEDFGAVVSLGAGGIHTEFLARNFKPGTENALFAADTPIGDSAPERLRNLAAFDLITRSHRGQPPRIAPEKITEALERFRVLASTFLPNELREFEVNPLVLSKGRLVALDALVTLATPAHESLAPKSGIARKPLDKIRRILEPRSIAILGVSERMNPGRFILRNTLSTGFDPRHLYIVKPGLESLDGCKCVPSLRQLPEPVDLMVLAISAAQVPETIQEVLATRCAHSLVIIPGGLEEKSGTHQITRKLHDALAASRETDWQGPVVNGGNCLGIRSVPGRYNTFFIPDYKLPLSTNSPAAPLAVLSQSGAFAISRVNKLGRLNPKFAITLGNQMDLTVGDYLEYLGADPDLHVFAVYVEGFKPLDGLKFLRAARAITASGRTVILYRAGRTVEGAQASASHTASIAGNYAVTRALCEDAGVLVAESVEDFEDLTRLFTVLDGKPAANLNLGAISNAGFECVAFADNLNGFSLPQFEGPARAALEATFAQAGISTLVDVHNPLDLTPMANDAAYEAAVRSVLSAPSIGAAIVGCVPLTPATQTLQANPGAHPEDLNRETAIGSRLARLAGETTKPWIAVVDGGTIYDALVQQLQDAGVPTFRAADRALRLFSIYCRKTRQPQPMTSR